jgi:hypothetical protein
MSKIILPSTIKLFERTRRLEALVIIYFVDLVCIMVLPFPYSILAFVLGGLIVMIIYATLESDMYSIVRTVNYDNLGVVTRDPGHISRFISGFVSLSLVTILSLAALFAFWWASSVVVLFIYFLIVMSMSRSVHRLTRTPAFNIGARPVKRRAPRKKQKPFQPSFNAPAARPDPGWDFDDPVPERPAAPPVRRTDPGWDIGPPSFEAGENEEAHEKPKKRKPKENATAPEAMAGDEDKWGRL